jgi:O-antigen/teichoic acid export membrane protein
MARYGDVEITVSDAKRDMAVGLPSVVIGGQILTSVLTAVLAGHLTLLEFEAYVVAAALFLLGKAIAPLGADKLALRLLPPLLAEGDRGRVAEFLRFALRRLFLGTLLVAAVGVGAALLLRDVPPGTRRAMLASVLALPAGALAQLGLEVLTAAGRGRLAATMVRLLVPGGVLAFVGCALWRGASLSGATVIAAWGVGWLAIAAAMLGVIGRDMPSGLRGGGRSDTEATAWRAAARPLWLFRVAMALLAQSGLLALEMLGAQPAAVAAYAIALAVIAPAVAFVGSTNRVYARDVAVLIARGDAEGLAELGQRRRRRISILLLPYLAVAFLLPAQLLGLLRIGFMMDAIWPIRIMSVATLAPIAFSLAPTILKYRDRGGILFRVIAASALVQVLLLALLVETLGAMGAAIGFAASTALLYGGFAFAAANEVGRIKSAASASNSAASKPLSGG